MTFHLSRDRARDLVERFTGRRILVVGDLMLDHFVIGGVSRISPEAPVPVVEFEREECRPGGAANVAHTIRALGGAPALVGLAGHDADRQRLAAALHDAGLPADLIVTDPSRPTTRKLRIVTTRRQQVARVDYEADREVSGDAERTLIDRATTAAADAAVIVVSDYLKGAVSPALMGRLVSLGREHGIPVLVDPKVPHLDYYAGATLVTPNHHEAEMATGIRIRTDAEAQRAAAAFRQRTRCTSVLVTRGEHGLWVLDGSDSSGGPERAIEASLPATAREVSDVTGAGDTVIGTLALAMAAGASLLEAAALANRAAGIAVGYFGPATVSLDELLAACG